MTQLKYYDTGSGTWVTAVVGSQGPQGSQGNQGLSGNQGAQGAASTVAGPQGSTGAQGPQGLTGSQGSTGAQGTQGPQGANGSQGAQGANGSQGAQGSQGFQGATGAQGSQGSQGTQGSQGADGAQGSTGSQGATGAQGTQGPQGAQGSTAFDYSGIPVTNYAGSSYSSKAWTIAPDVVTSGLALTAGVCYLTQIYVKDTFTPTRVQFRMSVGATLTAAYVGIYKWGASPSQTTPLFQTANIASSMATSSAIVTANFVSPTSLAPGHYAVGVVVTGASTASISSSAQGAGTLTNFNMTGTSGAVTLRNQSVGSGLTNLPDLATAGSPSSVAQLFFYVLS